MDPKTLRDTPPWEWPGNGGQMLLDTLRDKHADASDRLIAAKLAGNLVVIDDEGADALLSIVRSGDELEELRAQAAISLGPVLELADTEGFEDPEDVPVTEATFVKIQNSLREIYLGAQVPKEVRRRILEASVRAPQDWHQDAIRAAYASDDEEWKLTAVFCMQYVRGFDRQILEMLESPRPEIHYEAVRAAANWELDAAWPHVAALVASKDTRKPLLLTAIDAVANIRPREAGMTLVDLAGVDDEEVAEAVQEAMAEALADEAPDGEDDDEDDEK